MSIQTKKLGTLEYLTVEGITTPHCFTTRFGGVSTGALESMNLAIKLDEKKEYKENIWLVKTIKYGLIIG